MSLSRLCTVSSSLWLSLSAVTLRHKRSGNPRFHLIFFIQVSLAPRIAPEIAPPAASSLFYDTIVRYIQDNTGSKTTGTYNNWCLELHFAGGGTALRNQGDLFLGFLEGDIVGEVATGRLSMILDIGSSRRQKDPGNMSGTTPWGDTQGDSY
ncbi:hypothetical protein THAOC_13098 [Thalassiosira oceanica]|uniref:Uncharacterized protein n=1 Tax=Thalassiosira oceanica TaxID=159749 RepID=K0SLZ9_THAOC|nr:hypothetical protein THAOC_13098 [Thalassiosira oceanica]|eukprot:EJK65999.1 hypothetical protein THAOC_13098 [Thalassiosira oceanica]